MRHPGNCTSHIQPLRRLILKGSRLSQEFLKKVCIHKSIPFAKQYVTLGTQ